MTDIVIGFSKPKSWEPFAWLIMTGYEIPYDHVYIKFYSKSYDRHLIYQASKTIVNFMSEPIFTSNNVVVKEFTFNVTNESNKEMIQFAIDNAGKPYGVLEAFGMGLVRLCEIFGKHIQNPFRDGGKTYVCSELVSCILKDFTNLPIKQDMYDMSPKDLYNTLNNIKQ